MIDRPSNKYVDGIRQGDRAIVREIYDRIFPQVASWITQNSGNREDALDVFQDAIEAIIHKSYDDDFELVGDFIPYLFRICKYKWIDQLRKKKTVDKVRQAELSRLEEEETHVQVDQSFKSQQLHKALEVSYQKLSETCRKLIDMINQGISATDIADELNMTNANTVYRRKFGCMKRWKEILENNPNYLLYKRENEG